MPLLARSNCRPADVIAVLILLSACVPAARGQPDEVRSPEWWLARAGERPAEAPDQRTRWEVLRYVAGAQADRRDLEGLGGAGGRMTRAPPNGAADAQDDAALAAEQVALLWAWAAGTAAFVERVEKVEDDERRGQFV